MVKFVALFSLILSLSLAFDGNSEQSVVPVEQQQVVIIESAELVNPDLGSDDDNPYILSLSLIIPDSRCFETVCQLTHQLFVTQTDSQPIRAPPLFS